MYYSFSDRVFPLNHTLNFCSPPDPNHCILFASKSVETDRYFTCAVNRVLLELYTEPLVFRHHNPLLDLVAELLMKLARM